MRIKQMTRYMLKANLPVTAAFYAILLAFTGIVALTLSLNVVRASVGTGFAAMYFFFVIGIVSFYNFLKVGFSCSISRKTVFASMLLSGLILSLIAGAVETLVAWAVYLLDLQYSGSLTALGSLSIGSVPPVLGSLSTLIYTTLISYLGILSGFFIGGLYYRMSTALKVLVSVGVPALFMVVFPFVLFNVLPNTLGVEFMNRLHAVTRALFASPSSQMLLDLALVVVCAIFAWLLIRKAPVKDK